MNKIVPYEQWSLRNIVAGSYPVVHDFYPSRFVVGPNLSLNGLTVLSHE
jgi:hypothetical protein